MPDFVPMLCLDFDGVIHGYSKGWQGGEIYDNATPGFFDWLETVREHFRIVIYSSRSSSEPGRMAMAEWFVRQRAIWAISRGIAAKGDALNIEFAAEKPPAFVTIDDRAICFRGDWQAPELTAAALLAFKPWMHLAPAPPPVGPRLGLMAEIERAINHVSAEGGSDTPDFILAEYLYDCLEAFDKTVRARERWYGRACGAGSSVLEVPVVVAPVDRQQPF